MKREKSIQIPETLFMLLSKYYILDMRDIENENQIKKGLSEVIDRRNNHTLFSKYKNEKDPILREQYRQEYLDAVGIPDSFRSLKELKNEE